MNALVISYAKMINRGTCTIDQVPEEHRAAVKDYLANGETEPKAEEVNQTASKTSILGALTLPNIEDPILDVSTVLENGALECEFRNEDIFTPDVLDMNPFPIDISYSIERVENTYGKFKDDPEVEMVNRIGGFDLKISGTPQGNIAVRGTKTTILRIDIRVESFNYEPMRFSIYIMAM